ncbi:hypothetical protein BGX26_010590 [Mortierella sp. AD094]|nr:hypothetical protein BGX26_010590 [Mortierella sp. AD094]
MQLSIAFVILAAIILGAILFYYSLTYFGCSVYPKDKSLKPTQSLQRESSPNKNTFHQPAGMAPGSVSQESKPEPVSIQLNGEPLYGSTDALQDSPQQQPYRQQAQHQHYNQTQYQPPSLPMPTYGSAPYRSAHSPSVQYDGIEPAQQRHL